MIEFRGNRYELLYPIIMSCGCSGTAPKMRRMVRAAGVEVDITLTPNNARLKRYIKQENLKAKIPAIADSKHGVLYNPHTQQFIDLLKAPENEHVYENMRRVVDGR